MRTVNAMMANQYSSEVVEVPYIDFESSQSGRQAGISRLYKRQASIFLLCTQCYQPFVESTVGRYNTLNYYFVLADKKERLGAYTMLSMLAPFPATGTSATTSIHETCPT